MLSAECGVERKLITPEFLVWAIEYSCTIRGLVDGSDPERTERQLRAARAVSDARRERRVFEGFCIEPPNGFRIADGLAVYGGAEAVERACGCCPANALAEIEPGALAGCYGIVPVPLDPSPFFESIERGIERAYPDANRSDSWVVTMPGWYGLWIGSPLRAEQLLARYRVLELSAIDDEVTRDGIRQLMAGLNAASSADCRVHVALYPRGHVDGTQWRLVRHCPRCKAAWGEVDSRHCGVCGYEGQPAADIQRKARGLRPYFPLNRILGNESAAEFLVRYEAFREQRRSTGQA